MAEIRVCDVPATNIGEFQDYLAENTGPGKVRKTGRNARAIPFYTLFLCGSDLVVRQVFSDVPPTDPTLPASTPSFDLRRHCPPHPTTSRLHTPFFTPLIRISLRISLHISLRTELSKAGRELF